MRQGPKPTIRDVAASAGVSPATVSYVLSGRPGGASRISPSTQERVHAAVHDLGYVPNHAARGMRSGRTGLVAIAVADLEEVRARTLATAAARILQRHGYQAVILLGGAWRQFMLSGAADGVMLVGPGEDDGDAGILADLAVPGVVQPVIPAIAQPARLAAWAPDPVPAPGRTVGAAADAEADAEHAVALLLDRLRAGTPAVGPPADVGS